MWRGLLGFFALLLLASCANIGAPTGGSVDRIPPRVVDFEPELASTYFEGNSFTITFDEFVKLGSYRTQLTVSPPLAEDLGVRLRGKTLEVNWSDTLAENTTYVFQFCESVVDLNEGNVATDLVYAFSTGAELDSGLLRFSLRDAWSGEAIKGARVLLFEADDEWTNPSTRPAFVGVSGDDGACVIGYLPPRLFSAVAVVDVDANFMVGSREAFAWLDDPLMPAFSSDSVESSALQLDAPEGELTSYISGLRQDEAGLARLQLVDLGEQPVEVNFIGGAGDWHQDGDSLLLVSLDGATAARISHGATADTVQLFSSRKPVFPAVASPPARNMDARDVIGQALRLTAPIDTVISNLIRSKWVVAGDTLEQLGVSSWDRWTIQPLPAPDGAAVTMTMLPGALGWPSDTAIFSWATHPADHYGTLRVETPIGLVELPAQASRLWILLDASDEPLRFSSDAQPTFRRLLPGSYSLLWVDDRDGDGRWTGVGLGGAQGIAADSLHIDSLRHPERVLRSAGKIELRSDWEQTVVWE